MKAIVATVVGALALAWAGAAAAGPRIGFAEDATKYAADGGASLFSAMTGVGATTNRVAVRWDAGAPTTIQDQAFLDRMIPVAERNGIQVVFAIYPASASQAPTTQAAADSFCSYAAQVAQRYPYVKKVIVGNEPNQPKFWTPIWNADGTPAAPAALETVLATCYDKLKALDPTLSVIAAGMSPRGNDDAKAKSNSSLSPVRFIAALGTAYRSSGRMTPLFDAWSWHCYPNVNTDAVEKGYAWPNTGCVDAARVKLALYDAFHGTAQQVTVGYASARTTSAGEPLRTFVDETGWQVSVTGLSGYADSENVPTISEAQQAQNYEKLVHLANCEPSLTDFHFFHQIDEVSLAGFQSGLLRLDGSARPSADAVRQAIASDSGSCSGGVYAKLGTFVHPPTAVVPVYKTFPYGSPLPYATKTVSGGGIYVSLRAGEGFKYTIRFTSGKRTRTVAGAAPRMSAAAKVPAGFGKGTAKVVLTAETNPDRTSQQTLKLGAATP